MTTGASSTCRNDVTTRRWLCGTGIQSALTSVNGSDVTITMSSRLSSCRILYSLTWMFILQSERATEARAESLWARTRNLVEETLFACLVGSLRFGCDESRRLKGGARAVVERRCLAHWQLVACISRCYQHATAIPASDGFRVSRGGIYRGCLAGA